MKELLRTNDPVLLSWLTALLAGENIKTAIFDAHTSIVEGSIGALPRRLMVESKDHARARRILAQAEVKNHDLVFPEECP